MPPTPQPAPDWQFILTAVTAISSAIAALVAAVSARATRATAQEMERARIAQTRPLILLTTRHQGYELLLVIKNFGGPAADVSLKFLQSVPWQHGDDLNQAPLLSQPIPVVAPGEEHTITIKYWENFWFTHEIDETGSPIRTGWSRNPVDFDFDLTYVDPFTGQRFTETSKRVSVRHFAPTAAQAGLPEPSE